MKIYTFRAYCWSGGWTPKYLKSLGATRLPPQNGNKRWAPYWTAPIENKKEIDAEWMRLHPLDYFAEENVELEEMLFDAGMAATEGVFQ